MIPFTPDERRLQFTPAYNIGEPLDPDAIAVAGAIQQPTMSSQVDQPVPATTEIDPDALAIANKAQLPLMTSLMGASRINPEQAAEATRLGKQLGIGQDIALRNIEEMRQRAFMADVQRRDIARVNPILSKFLSNRSFANQASDDISSLSKLEQMEEDVYDFLESLSRISPTSFSWQTAAEAAAGFRTGQLMVRRGKVGSAAMLRSQSTDLDWQWWDKYTEEMQAIAGDAGFWRATGELIGQMPETAEDVLEAATVGSVYGGTVAAVGGQLGPQALLPEEVLTVPAGMLIGATAGAIGALFTSSARTIAGNNYMENLRRGIDPTTARLTATGVGLAGGALEMVGVKFVGAPFRSLWNRLTVQAVNEAVTRPTVGKAFSRFGVDYLKATGGEIGTETGQQIVEIIGDEVAGMASDPMFESRFATAEGRTGIKDELVEVIKRTAMGMSVIGAIGPSANFYFDTRRADRAKQSQRIIGEVVETINETRLKERNPDALEEYADDALDETPAYIRGSTLRQLMTDAKVSEADLDAIVPGLSARLREAEAAGNFVSLPLSQFGVRLSGTPLGDAMVQHLTIDPRAMTPTELAAFERERQELTAEAEKLLEAKTATDEAFVQEADEIHASVKQKLVAAGRDELAADAEATIYQAMIVTAAAREGMTPKQYADQYGLREVVGEGQAAGPRAVDVPGTQTIQEFEQAEAQAANYPDDVRAAIAERDQYIKGAREKYRGKPDGQRRAAQAAESAGKRWDRENPELAARITEARRPRVEALERARSLQENASQEQYNQEAAERIALLRQIDDRLAAAGFTLEHTSDFGSRYYSHPKLPEGRTIRVSDHELPSGNPSGFVYTDVGTRGNVARPDVLTELDDFIAENIDQRAAPGVMEQAAISEAAQIDAQAEAISDDDVLTAESQPDIPQSIDDAISLEAVARLATGQTWNRGRDLKVAMQEEAGRLAQEAGVNLSLDTPQTAEYLKRIGVRDALYALRQNPNSVGWYDEKTRQAIAVMSLVHPELLTNENARFAFTWALAVTSNGIKVDKNFELANAAYSQYKRDGRMPTDLTAGQAQAAINRSLGMFNELVDAWGIDNVRKFTQTEYTIQELRYLVQDFDAGGEFASTVVKGAGILGPKIGNGFFSNLYGDFRSLTMDRWLIRTWGRWTGTLIKEMPVQTERARVRLDTVVRSMDQAQRAELGAVLREYASGTQEFMDSFEAGEAVDLGVLAALVQKASMDVDGRARMNATETGQEFRKSGNSLAKYLDGQKEAPSGPKERVQIRGIFGDILRELQQLPEYADLTMADLQAALWYAEKRLYETAREDIQVDEESIEGYADEEAPDYANAAAKVARASGVPEKSIASTLKKESNDERSRRARSQDAAGQPVVGRNTGAVRGFTAAEKRRFNGAAVIRGERSNRGAVAGSPRAYERRGREAAPKPRLVKKLGAKVIAEYGPARRLRNALKVVGDSEKQFGTPNFFELEKSAKSAEAFHKRIMQSKAQNDFGASVFAYPVNEYEDMRLFLSDDGTSGFALKGDDIVSVFSMSDQSMLHALMEMAVSAGGRRLDAFDTVLPHFYAPHGFSAVARLRWDDAQAPAGWNKETFRKFNNGEPDVVFMVYDPAYFGQYSTKDAKVARSYAAAVRAQDAEIAQMATAGMYQQAAAGSARGGFDPQRMRMFLTSKQDASTTIHELVHFALQSMTDLARSGNASPQVLADLDLLFQWRKEAIAGDTPQARLATWLAMPIDQQRTALQEPLAYNGEIYIFEGKAPTEKLQPVFDRLRAFMLRVYKSIRDEINAIYRQQFGEDLPMLTPEVRGVFDRIMASDYEIRQQAAVNEMRPQFQTQEQSGMDDATWAAYQEMQQEAMDASITDLSKASLRQMQWLSGARAKVLRDMQEKHEALRKEVAVEMAAAVRVESVYRAITFLRYGKFRDEDGQEVPVDGPHKLDTATVDKMYELEPPALQPKLLRGKYGMLEDNGLNPDVVAEMFGYTSGDQMIRAIEDAKPIKEEIKARTDAEMTRRYGDMNTRQAQEAEVQKALHNEARARMVAVELRWAAKMQQPVRVLLDAAKSAAEQVIGRKRIRDLRPSEFVTAEAQASREASGLMENRDPSAAAQAAATRAYNEAVAAGKTADEATAESMAAGVAAADKARTKLAEFEARYPGMTREQRIYTAKRHQLLNNQLARVALEARERVDKDVKYLRKVLRDSNVAAMGAEAADQIGQLLEQYEVAPLSVKRLDERKNLAQYMAAMEEQGIVPDIAPALIADAQRVNYREMTVDQFNDLVDAVRQIEYIGKNARKIRLANERVAFNDKRDEIVTRIRATGRLRGLDLDPRSPLTNIGRTIASLQSFAAAHLKAASVAFILDGGKDDGPLWNTVVRTANAAADMETRMRSEATAKLAEILKPVFALGRMGGKGMFFPSINRSLNREAVLAIAMNMGNAGNMQRLLDGEGWTMEQIRSILQSMTAAEWNAVQQVWDHLETYRPLVAAKERRLYGKEPNWVEPQPLTVKTADGQTLTLRGGYYPVKYDPVASDRVATFDEVQEAKDALRGTYTAATTRRSFTKARAEKVVGRPILYTLDAMFSGVNDVIHDLAWHEWLISTNRLLRDEKFANAVRETRGPEFLRQLREWAKSNAAGDRAANVEGVLSWLRQGISASGLGFNVMSAALQITGFNQSVVRVGAKWVGIGIAEFTASPFATSQFVREKSSFMAERQRTQFRELNELRNTVRGKAGIRRVLAQAYVAMMTMQRAVDTPTWVGAYRKALDAGKDDATAVALADQAVKDSQGSGLTSDLAAIERGGPGLRLFTVFYGYMNTVFNMAAVQTYTARSRGKLAADYVMLLVVPVVLAHAIKAVLTPDTGDDEFDPEALARKLAAEELSYLMGTMVVAREFGGAAEIVTGAEGVRMGYGGPAGVRAIGEVYNLATQASQGDFDRAFFRSAINTLGAFTGLPSAQINRTIDGVEAILEDEVEGAEAVVAPITGVKR